MRILWLNWKDLKNPEAGGAELFTHEVSRRLALWGYEITLFTSSFPGASAHDSYDGISIIRKGTRTSVQGEAKRFYNENPGHYDLVIDEINTKPFMAPKFVTGRVIALIHQLAREIWFYETPLPLALAGYFVMERVWLNRYRETTTITVSRSSQQDLLALGFKKVYVIPDGLSYKPLPEVPAKEDNPAVLYLGRLTKAKRVDHLIAAFDAVRAKWPKAKLWVVGDGHQKEVLEAQANEGVIFFGKLDHEKVSEMLGRAWVLAYPSVREGFGLTVIEANAHGTPAVGYDVPGIRDSIIDGKTGLLAPSGNIAALSGCLVRIIGETQLRQQMAQDALEYSREFSWDKTAIEFRKIVDADLAS
jgi:glycosyltransferase involved in cell wall biosynthesis